MTTQHIRLDQAAGPVSTARLIRRWSRRLIARLAVPLMLAPAILVLILFFVGGLALAFVQSLGYLPLIGEHEVSLRFYGNLLADDEFRRSLLFTFYVTFVATALSAILAIAIALVLRPHFRGKGAVMFLFQLPLPIPHLVGAIGMLLLLTQSGLIARVGHAAGLVGTPADFPALVFDRTGIGIILTYVWKEIPFIGVVVVASLQGVGADYEDIARTLGAGPWQRFRYVLLPLILPAVLSTSIIVFAFVFGAFEVPFLIGAPYPAMTPVLAYNSYTDPDLHFRSESMAMSMIITVIVMALVFGYMRISRRIRAT